MTPHSMGISAQPLSCGARHERGWAKNPNLIKILLKSSLILMTFRSPPGKLLPKAVGCSLGRRRVSCGQPSPVSPRNGHGLLSRDNPHAGKEVMP